MNRNILLFTFIISVNSLFSQETKWHFGIEPTINAPFNGIILGLGTGFNGFVKYDLYEFYIGTDIFKTPKTLGLETGFKYHFRSDKRLSHFFLDLNFQNSRWSDGCALPVKYNYEPKDITDPNALSRVKTYILSTALGYEVNFTKWLSSTIAIGPGLNYYTEKNTWITIYKNDKDWKGVILTKAAIRVTI